MISSDAIIEARSSQMDDSTKSAPGQRLVRSSQNNEHRILPVNKPSSKAEDIIPWILYRILGFAREALRIKYVGAGVQFLIT